MGHNSCTWEQQELRRESAAHQQTWAIVLAGGDGTRMRPFIQDWLGEDRPKQYCAFVGRRSMLEHTHDRAARLTGPGRQITVVGRGHTPYLNHDHPALVSGALLEQPENLGTAPGIFVPLAHVLDRDPEATVLIFPSDHFVFPEHAFLAHVRAAAEAARKMPRHIVLLGARPESPDTDYGYICPVPIRDTGATGCVPVERFHEKPTAETAALLIDHGALWNTLVCAVRAETLWNIGWECVPAMMERLERYRYAVHARHRGRADAGYERRAFMRLYGRLQAVDFSRHILEKVPHRILVHAMPDVQWSDWGRPERIVETIDQLDASPAVNAGTLRIWRRDARDPGHASPIRVQADYWSDL